MIYYIEIRQRIEGLAHYMVWKRVPGRFRSRRAMDEYATYMVKQSHSLDIRGVRKDGNLTHRINYRVEDAR